MGKGFSMMAKFSSSSLLGTRMTAMQESRISHTCMEESKPHVFDEGISKKHDIKLKKVDFTWHMPLLKLQAME